MKKLLLCSLLLVPLFLWQCSHTNDNPVTAGGAALKSVEIAIAVPPGFDTLVARATVRVTGEDMDPILVDLFVDSNSIYGKVPNIPVGSNRLFEVVVFDHNGDEAFRGSKNADVSRGLNYVNIILYKVNDGTAIINGKFDDSTDYSPISLWHHTSLMERDIAEKKVTVMVTMNASCTTMANLSYYDDLFEYYWIAYDLSTGLIIDSIPWSKSNSVSMITNPMVLSWNQTVGMIISARYKTHPQNTTTDTITIEIKDGWMIVESEAWVRTDTLRLTLTPMDTFNIDLYSTLDTIHVAASGTWCMGTDLCSSADGDCDLDKSKFFEPDYCGGQLLARCGEKVYKVGEHGTIIDPDEDFKVTLFANRMFGDNDESGAVKLVIYHTHP